MWLVGVVVRRYIDFLILLIPTPLVSVLFCSSIPTFCSFLNCFIYMYIQYLHVHIYIAKIWAIEKTRRLSSLAIIRYNHR